MKEYIIWVFNIIILFFYVAILFLLFEIKSRIVGKVSRTFVYAILAIFNLGIIRIIHLLNDVEIMPEIPYLIEGFVFLFVLLVRLLRLFLRGLSFVLKVFRYLFYILLLHLEIHILCKILILQK